jgi:hypothetical protein
MVCLVGLVVVGLGVLVEVQRALAVRQHRGKVLLVEMELPQRH